MVTRNGLLPIQPWAIRIFSVPFSTWVQNILSRCQKHMQNIAFTEYSAIWEVLFILCVGYRFVDYQNICGPSK
jgi:hypothetical protein